jgi:hypothetical protein
VSTLDQEHLVNVVRDAREELDRDLESLASDDFALDWSALNNAWSRDRRQVDIEFERHFANVLDVEVFRGAFVVGNFTEVEFVG